MFVRYEDQALQNAYENACDCLYYGMSSRSWNDCGIPAEKRKEVWTVAWYDMGDGCEEGCRKSVAAIMEEAYGAT